MPFPPAPPAGLRGRLPAPPPHAPREDEEKKEMEEKIRALEKKLEKEHEQVLLANLKSKEEKEIASRVETSIKDIQEKLRRDRREAQTEETRLKLEAKIAELENRLVQERETWVSTLKNQMATRENQDKEIETHFTMRIQEMERRWLEEKAHWQTLTTQKAEEIRKLKDRLDQLEKVDVEYQKTQQAKESLEAKVADLEKAKGELEIKVSAMSERERDYFQMKADLQMARDQLRMSQEKYDRDLPSVRASAKEREQRLLADNEKLQTELDGVARRIRAEYEAEIRRLRAESEGELKKARVQADLAGAALQRMRSVGSALEKQAASLRVQAAEAVQLKEEMKRINDRYKAEFIVLQRKWQDREAQLRKEAEDTYAKALETEKAKIKLRAQEEIQNRVLKVQEQLRKEAEGGLLEKERAIRLEMERQVSERAKKAQADLDEMRRKLEEELKRKSDEFAKRDLYWQERQVASESENNTLKAAVEDLRARLAREEDLRLRISSEKGETDKSAVSLHEKIRVLEAAADEARRKFQQEEKKARELSLEKESRERARAADGERLAEVRGQVEALESKLAAAGNAIEALRGEKVLHQETIAKIEAEHSRQLETWRRKLDLVRRDSEARIRGIEAERAKACRELSMKRGAERGASEGGVVEKLKGLFGGKAAPPEPPAPPVMGSL